MILFIWIIIRDAQMFQRASRRKFERLDSFEYNDDAEFEDGFPFTKEEMRSDKFILRLWDDHNAGQKKKKKKNNQKRYSLTF